MRLKTAFMILLWLGISLACTLTSQSEEDDPISTAIPTVPTLVLTSTATTAPTQTTAPTIVRPTSTTASSACTNRASYISDITVPDGTPIQHGATFVKTWRMQNTGTCTWGSGYRFVHLSGEVTLAGTGNTQNFNVRPGDTIDISLNLILDPARTFTYGERVRSTFQMQAPDGTRFGSRPYVEVIPQLPAQTTCTHDSDFVADLNVPDGTPVQHGVAFVKTWRIKNSGTCTWGSGYQFVHLSGEIFPASSVPMPTFNNVQPGQTIDVTVTLMLPPERQYIYGQAIRSTFQMQAPDGSRFGTRPYVEVVPQPFSQ